MARKKTTKAKVARKPRIPGGGGLGGRPRKSTPAREAIAQALAGTLDWRIGRRLERLAIRRARQIYKLTQVEAARTLYQGMRGELPGSDARTMADCAKTIAAKGGNADATILELANKQGAPPLRIAIGTEEIDAAVREAEEMNDRGDA